MAGAESASSMWERYCMLLVRINDIVEAASNVPVHKQQLAELAGMVDRMKPILQELKNQNVHNASESLNLALRNLEASMEDALKLLQANNCSSSIWLLLLRCPDFLKKMQDITHRIAVSLDQLSLASLDLSLKTKQKMAELCETMKTAEFKAAVETEEVILKLQDAYREEQTNNQKYVQVLLEIAKQTGASVDSSFIVREKEAIKKEKADLEEDKRHAEADILQQVIAFLSRLDMRSSSSTRSDSSRCIPLRQTEDIPIRSFCCRMTGELMEDPVDIDSGYTFERRAIEAWFAEGNKICPVTKEPLESFQLYPNVSLSDSIKEWKERNVIQRLKNAASEINSHDPRTASESLSELCELLSSAGDVDVELVVPRLVQLPRVFDEGSIRKEAMQCLSILAHRSSENKELITREGGVDLAVECLASENAEIRKQGVMALLELSEYSKLCGDIGKAKNCIPRLVALVSGQDTHLAKTAEQVLEHLSGLSDNLTSITHANYFTPLVQKITQGSTDDKISMAVLLGSTKLTDYSRATLVQKGILPSLVQMLSEIPPEANLAVLTALQNLSSNADTREALLVTTDVVKPVLEFLRNRQAPESRCGEIAAELLADLVIQNSSAETHDHHADLTVLTEKENIQGLVALLATADIPYPIKGHLLQILLGVASMKTESGTKEEMRDAGAIQLLLSLCDEENTTMRLSTLRLLDSLTEDGNGLCLVNSLEETHVRNFVMALSRSDVEEKTAVSGILSNMLTHDPRIIDMLLPTDALRAVMGLLSTSPTENVTDRLIENALGVFLLFTSSLSSSDRVLRMLTEFETTSVLVRILNVGTGLAKQRAATGLAQLSLNTMRLSRPATQTIGKDFFCCCGPVGTDVCVVHGNICSAKDSFCLVEANAIVPLVKTLGETECCADEAALGALDTLLGSETFGGGIKAIKGAKGLIPVKDLLTKGSPKAQERVLPVLVNITVHKEFHDIIGHPETHELIRLMQQRADPVRKIAATILGNIGEIPKQSNYF